MDLKVRSIELVSLDFNPCPFCDDSQASVNYYDGATHSVIDVSMEFKTNYIGHEAGDEVDLIIDLVNNSVIINQVGLS